MSIENKVRNNLTFMVKTLLSLLLLFLIPLYSFASINSLTGIDIKNEKNKYNIILKLEGNTKIKKVITSPDTFILFLNSTLPSDTMQIIYDNTSNISNVIVQKKNSDSTKIVFEGKDISKSDIFTKNISTGLITPVELNTLFFGINKKLFLSSALIMFFWLLIFNIKSKRKKRIPSLQRNSQFIRNSQIKSNGYVSTPQDFVINEYMEYEKIKKAC